MTTPRIDYVTRQEAADYLKVTTATLDRWVRAKKLPRYRIAGTVSARFKISDLDAIVLPENPQLVREFEEAQAERAAADEVNDAES